VIGAPAQFQRIHRSRTASWNQRCCLQIPFKFKRSKPRCYLRDTRMRFAVDVGLAALTKVERDELTLYLHDLFILKKWGF